MIGAHTCTHLVLMYLLTEYYMSTSTSVVHAMHSDNVCFPMFIRPYTTAKQYDSAILNWTVAQVIMGKVDADG